MNGDGEIAGYNKGKVEALRTTIDNTYKSVVETITSEIKTTLVDPMSTAWYAPEAVQEFKDIKTAVENMEKSLKDAYDAYRGWIEQMGQSWAENTGGQSPRLSAIGEKSSGLNVSGIKNDNGGNVTLDETKAKTVAGQVKELRNSILKKVQSKHQEMEASAAFIGHGQAAAATACFVKVADAIGSLMASISTIGTRLEQYAKKYKEVGEKVASEFGKARVSVSSN